MSSPNDKVIHKYVNPGTYIFSYHGQFTKVWIQFKLERMTRPYPRWAMLRGNSVITLSNYRESFETHRHDGASNLNLSVSWGKQSRTEVLSCIMLLLGDFPLRASSQIIEVKWAMLSRILNKIKKWFISLQTLTVALKLWKLWQERK